MRKINAAPSPEALAEVWSDEFNEAITRAAGKDGRLSVNEATRVVKTSENGDQFFADDALKFLQLHEQKSVAVSKLAAWAPTYIKDAAAKVVGPDGRLSFQDAQQLPGSLIEDFYLLRGRALPSGPPSELAMTELALQTATEKMTMPSETDAAFRVVSSWRLGHRPIDAQTIRDLLGPQHDALISEVMWVPPETASLASRTPVEQVDAAQFFERLGTPADASDPASVRQAEQFKALQAVLEQQLNSMVVFRFGTVNISTFIVGRTPSGELAGLLTGQVET